ncbi:unnamed protein product [Penicillium salamii]|nr:unnamed protein product [Penicillium salamii]
MHRKTHQSRLFGKPLLELPKIDAKTVAVEFCPAEAYIHQELRDYFIEKVNDLVKNHEKQKLCILELILKFRMFVSHLLVAQNFIEMILNGRIMNHLKKLANEDVECHAPSATIARLLVSVVEEPTVHLTLPSDDAQNEHARSRPRENLGLMDESSALLNRLFAEEDYMEILQRKNCAMCHNPPLPFFITSCHHRYCERCFDSLADEHGNVNATSRQCLACEKSIESVVFCYDFYESNRSSPESESAKASRSKKRSNVDTKSSKQELRSKKQRTENRKTSDQYTKWMGSPQPSGETGGPQGAPAWAQLEVEPEPEPKINWVAKIGSLTPGAKHTAVRKQIETWLTEDEDVKIVVFAEFLGSIKLPQDMCITKNWKYTTITGRHSTTAREVEVEKFRNDPKMHVLIATMKTGGIGLNLTMANKCIICDQWWNAAMEQQAYCRLHRIGQLRDVEYVKIVVTDTIDEWILRLQQKKTNEINHYVGGSQLSDHEMLKELLSVFGDVSEREGGLWITCKGPDPSARRQGKMPSSS